MKRFSSIAVIVILIAAAVAIIISSLNNADYQIVKLKGADTYSNHSYDILTSSVGNNSDGVSALPLFNNELVYIDNDNEELFYLYKIEDGTSLEFRWEDFKLYLNEEVIFVRIDEDPAVLEWLRNTNEQGKTSLRSLTIDDDLPWEYLSELQKLGELKPKIDLYLQNDREAIDFLLDTFDPGWIILSEDCDADGKVLDLKALKRLEFLFIDSEFLEYIDLSELEQLNNLIISDMNSDIDMKELDLPSSIHRLYLFGSEFTDLEFITRFKSLEHLGIITSEEPISINPLKNLKSLISLNLTYCESITDIRSLAEIKTLKRLAVPSTLQQDDFDEIISELRGLEIVSLVAAENISSLNAVKKHPKISCLSVIDSEEYFDIDSLAVLTGLDYLSVFYSGDKDSTKMKYLEEKLPDTLIVPTQGLCLGSGWLLLLFPFILLLGGLFIMKSRRSRTS